MSFLSGSDSSGAALPDSAAAGGVSGAGAFGLAYGGQLAQGLECLLQVHQPLLFLRVKIFCGQSLVQIRQKLFGRGSLDLFIRDESFHIRLFQPSGRKNVSDLGFQLPPRIAAAPAAKRQPFPPAASVAPGGVPRRPPSVRVWPARLLAMASTSPIIFLSSGDGGAAGAGSWAAGGGASGAGAGSGGAASASGASSDSCISCR